MCIVHASGLSSNVRWGFPQRGRGPSFAQKKQQLLVRKESPISPPALWPRLRTPQRKGWFFGQGLGWRVGKSFAIAGGRSPGPKAYLTTNLQAHCHGSREEEKDCCKESERRGVNRAKRKKEQRWGFSYGLHFLQMSVRSFCQRYLSNEKNTLS